MAVTSFIICGERKLSGRLWIHGAKNAALPILAAAILHPGTTVLHQCPDILDVRSTLKMLEFAGCVIHKEADTVIIDAADIHPCGFPTDWVSGMRSSILFLGAMLGRCGEICLDYPGGCSIGSRPVDIHLKALERMGATVVESDGKIHCRSSRLKGCRIRLPYPSVGATENILMAAARAEGVTVLENAAREPEIDDLCGFLCAIGVPVCSDGRGRIWIDGNSRTKDAVYTIMPDRIVSGTYLCAAAATGGSLELPNGIPAHLEAVLEIFERMGCSVERGRRQGIYMKAPARLKAAGHIHTAPFPGFPTDMQSQIMAVLAKAGDVSRIYEHIFEDRFKTVYELRKMGADIWTDSSMAVVRGKEKLYGARVRASDLRGGAALIIAGLAAEGETVVENGLFVERGYQNICGDLKKIGACICHTEN